MARRSTAEPTEAPQDVEQPPGTPDADEQPTEAPQDALMESPDGDTHRIVAAGVQALLALGWTIVE